MLFLWDAIEADFFRDYGIPLMEQLDYMSWRRFRVLLHNLNPYGAVASRIMAENDSKTLDTTPEEDEEAAKAFFSSIVSI